MRLHCETAKRQANAQAAGSILAFETCKFFEDVFSRVGRNSRPVILHPELYIRAIFFCADLDG